MLSGRGTPQGENSSTGRERPAGLKPATSPLDQDALSVMHLIFKKFNTLVGYIAENIKKIEE